MKRPILVTYTTNAGSTKEVARCMADRIKQRYPDVEFTEMSEVTDIAQYSGVVIGGPMIMGWHRKALRFVRKHRNSLSAVPYYVFMTAMKVTGGTDDPRIYIDSGITETAADRSRLSIKERHTTVDHYIEPIAKIRGLSSPEKIAIIGGKLDYTKLKFPQVLFVMLIVGARPGDKRKWEMIEEWADSLLFKPQGEPE